MSGTTSLCLQQQYHNTTHDPLVGGLLYSFQAGTLNPQNAYRSAALTAGSEFANPVVLDASARVPQMFYADGLIRLIMTDKNGVAQFDYDNVPVIGSSGGSGSIDTTDTTRLYGTGDLKIRYGTGSVTGFVRCNGKGIGNTGATGADEFADPTAQALFQYLWNISNGDLSLAVFPSRGASAVADWGANKSIATPDFRGRVIGGLDGMGGLARANNLSAAKWDILGQAFDGFETRTILENQMPVHGHDVTVSSIATAVSGNIIVTSVTGSISLTSFSGTAAAAGCSGGISVTSISGSCSGSYSGSASVTVPAGSGSIPFAYTAPGAVGGGIQTGSGFGIVQNGTTTITIPSVGAGGSSSGTFSGSISGTGGGTFSGTTAATSVTGTGSGTFSGGTGVGGAGAGTFSGTGTGTGSGTAANKGGGQPYNITQPTRLVTVYMRL